MPRVVVQSNLVKPNNIVSIRNNVFQKIPPEVVQEIYECFRDEIIDKEKKERYPDGGISIMDCVLLNLKILTENVSLKQLEQESGISDSSLNRNLRWFVQKVRIKLKKKKTNMQFLVRYLISWKNGSTSKILNTE